MQNPPLYSKTYHLSELVFQSTRSFPKHLRPTLGRKLEESALDLLILTKRILFQKDSHELKAAIDLVDQSKILVQLSHDLTALSHHEYGHLSDHLSLIGKMLAGLGSFRKQRSIQGQAEPGDLRAPP
jgi:hypothetical protein